MTNRRLAVLAVLAVSGVIIALGVAAELVLRATVAPPLGSPQPQVRYDPHPGRRFTLRPSQEGFTLEAPFRVDASGLRSNGRPAPSAPQHRIVGLGDSFTFGMGVRDDQTWPSRLEHYLSEEGQSVAVTNAGTISYDSYHELALLREISSTLSPPPELVIHALYWNDYLTKSPPPPDAPSVLTPDGYFLWDETSRSASALRRALRSGEKHSRLAFVASRAVAWARDGLTRGRVAESYYARIERELEAGLIDTAGFAAVRAVYRELQSLGDTAGFRTFVVIMPVLGVVAHQNAGEQPYPRFIRELLSELGIPFLDAHELVGTQGLGPSDFLPYNRHLGARGYDVIARALSPRIAAMLSP